MRILYYKIRAIGVTWLLRLLPRNQPIVFQGSNSALSMCEQVSVLGFSKVLLVTDKFLHQSGILDGIKQVLRDTDVKFAVFDEIQPDPDFEQVIAGEALLRKEDCEAVIGVGGGSVLDAAKMIALMHNNPGDLAFFDGVQKSKNAGLTMFAIPTTAGTGSEITPASVITDQKTHRKVPIADGKLVPHYIALDAVLMKSMPPTITAATGMDALTHAVESYLSKASNPSTESQARASIRLIFKNLVRAWHDGEDMKAREAMALAAFYAGSAFGRTSVGYAHGIAHQLGRVCGTSHGESNAMVLPEVLLAYGECVHERLSELALLLDLGDPGDSEESLAQQFIQRIVDIRREMQLPTKPEGLQPDDVDGIVKEAIIEAGNLYPVPRYLSASELGNVVRGLLPAA